MGECTKLMKTMLREMLENSEVNDGVWAKSVGKQIACVTQTSRSCRWQPPGRRFDPWPADRGLESTLEMYCLFRAAAIEGTNGSKDYRTHKLKWIAQVKIELLLLKNSYEKPKSNCSTFERFAISSRHSSKLVPTYVVTFIVPKHFGKNIHYVWSLFGYLLHCLFYMA